MKHLPENSAVLLNRLQNQLFDVSLPQQLMRIAIEGPELTDVNFKEISDCRTDEFKL